jgi:hypothetical protein
VLVKVLDNETNTPVSFAKVNVVRKGKKGWLTEKESMLVNESLTNTYGEVLVDFKYDRGNTYALFVYPPSGYFQTGNYHYVDLEKGKNQETVYLYQQSFIKLNLISNQASGKVLDIKIDEATSVYYTYYSNSTAVNKMVFCSVNSSVGNKSLTWSVDSAGTRNKYASPIQLKGHDTVYATIHF